MSAETSGDVCQIKDEDVLRKMWQDTEDFGKKKEIRSHMYKLREERLRNFYVSDGTDIQTHHDTSIKNENRPNHAQSLLDHSFLSMKTKEIRDSESPTKDMHQFRSSSDNNGNRGWEIVSKNEVSDDGKTHTSTNVATTSGSEKIDKGVANYSAKCEQKASVYEDGDANNFTKSSTAASKSVLQQEAKGGDDNSNFQSFSTSSSSSSKTVTQHRSSSDLKPSSNDSSVVVRKTYTTDVPTDLKRSPNYIDGNTTVTTETRTLPDGSKVTTTRYETKGTSSTMQQQKFHTEQQSRTTYDERQTQQTVKQLDHDVNSTNTLRNVTDNNTVSNTAQVEKHYTVKDTNNVSEKVHYRNQDVRSTRQENQDDFYIAQTIREKEYIPRDRKSSSTITDVNKENTVTNNTTKITRDDGKIAATVKTTKIVREEGYAPQNCQPEPEPVPNDENTTRTTTVHKNVDGSTVTTLKTTKIIREEGNKPHQPSSEPEYGPNDDNTTRTTTVKKNDDGSTTTTMRTTKIIRADGYPQPEPVPKTIKTTSVQNNDNVNIVKTTQIIRENDYYQSGKQPEPDHTPRSEKVECPAPPGIYTPALRTPGEFTPTPSTPGDRTPINSKVQKQIQPQEIIIKLSPKPENNSHPNEPSSKSTTEKVTSVSTHSTYKTDFTSKRISVDISPTHDAFARSLRASPDHDQKRGSTRSLKSSTSSLRTSVSPEKKYPEYRDHTSPDKRHPAKSPSPSKPRSDSRESTPTKKLPNREINTDTITRRRKTDTYTTTKKIRSRSPSPTTSTSDIEYTRKTEIVTDLDVDDLTTTTKTKKPLDRPDSLDFNSRQPGKYTPSSTNKKPLTSPKTPEKTFKRRDTYDERCRQILGISEKTTDNKKTTERTNSRKTLIETSPKKLDETKPKGHKPNESLERPGKVTTSSRRPMDREQSTTSSVPKGRKPQSFDDLDDSCRRPKENRPTSKSPDRPYVINKETDDYYIKRKIAEHNRTVSKTQKVPHFDDTKTDNDDSDDQHTVGKRPSTNMKPIEPDRKSPKKSQPEESKPRGKSPQKIYTDIQTTDEYYVTNQETTVRSRNEKSPDKSPGHDTGRKTTKNEHTDKRSPDRKSPIKDSKITQKAKPKVPTQPREQSPDISEYTDEYCVTTTHISDKKQPKSQKPMTPQPGEKTIPRNISPQKTHTNIETTNKYYVTNEETTIRSKDQPNRKSPNKEYDEPERRPEDRPSDEIDEYSNTTEYSDRKITKTTPDRRSPTKDSKVPDNKRPNVYADKYCVTTTTYTSDSKEPKTKQPDDITDDDYVIKKISELRPNASQPRDNTTESKPKGTFPQKTHINLKTTDEETTVRSGDDEPEYSPKFDRPLDELDEYCITAEYTDRKTTKQTPNRRYPIKDSKVPELTTQKTKPKVPTQSKEQSPDISEYTDEYCVTTTHISDKKQPKSQKPMTPQPGEKTIPSKPKNISLQKTHTNIETTDEYYVTNEQTTIQSRDQPNRKSPDKEYDEPEHGQKRRPVDRPSDELDEYSITAEYTDRKTTIHSPNRSPIKDSKVPKSKRPTTHEGKLTQPKNPSPDVSEYTDEYCVTSATHLNDENKTKGQKPDEDYLKKKISELRPITSQPGDKTLKSKPKGSSPQKTHINIETTDEYYVTNEEMFIQSKDHPNRRSTNKDFDEPEHIPKRKSGNRPTEELDEYCTTTEYTDRITTKQMPNRKSPIKDSKVLGSKQPTLQEGKPSQPKGQSPDVSEYTDEYCVTTSTNVRNKKHPKLEKPDEVTDDYYLKKKISELRPVTSELNKKHPKPTGTIDDTTIITSTGKKVITKPPKGYKPDESPENTDGNEISPNESFAPDKSTPRNDNVDYIEETDTYITSKVTDKKTITSKVEEDILKGPKFPDNSTTKHFIKPDNNHRPKEPKKPYQDTEETGICYLIKGVDDRKTVTSKHQPKEITRPIDKFPDDDTENKNVFRVTSGITTLTKINQIPKDSKQPRPLSGNYKPTSTKPGDNYSEETTEDHYTTHKTVKKQLRPTEANKRPQETGPRPTNTSIPANRIPTDQITLEKVDRNKTTSKTIIVSKDSKHPRPIADTIPDDDLSDDSIEDTEERYTTRTSVKTEVGATKSNKINKVSYQSTQRPSDSIRSLEEDTDVCDVTERDIDRKTITTKTNKIMKDTKRPISGDRKPTDHEPEEDTEDYYIANKTVNKQTITTKASKTPTGKITARPSDSSKTAVVDDYNETTSLIPRDSERPASNRKPNDDVLDDTTEDLEEYYTTSETAKKRTTTLQKPESVNKRPLDSSRPIGFKPSGEDTNVSHVTSEDVSNRRFSDIPQGSKSSHSTPVKSDYDIPGDNEETEEYYTSTKTGKKQIVTTKTDRGFESSGKRPTNSFKPLKTSDVYNPVQRQPGEHIPSNNIKDTEDYYTSNIIVKEQHVSTDHPTNKRLTDSKKTGIKPNKETLHYNTEGTNEYYATNEIVKHQITASKTGKKPDQTTKRPSDVDRSKGIEPVDSEDSDVCYVDYEETIANKTNTTYKNLDHPQREVGPKPSDIGKIPRRIDDDDEEISYTSEDMTNRRTTTTKTTKQSNFKPKQTDDDSPQKSRGPKYPSDTTKLKGQKPTDTTEKRYVTNKQSKPNRKPEYSEDSSHVTEDMEENYTTTVHQTTINKPTGKTPTAYTSKPKKPQEPDERYVTRKTSIQQTNTKATDNRPNIPGTEKKRIKPRPESQSPDRNYQITVEECYEIDDTGRKPEQKIKPKDASKSPDRIYRLNKKVDERHTTKTVTTKSFEPPSTFTKQKPVEKSPNSISYKHKVVVKPERKTPEQHVKTDRYHGVEEEVHVRRMTGTNQTRYDLSVKQFNRPVTEYTNEYYSPKDKPVKTVPGSYAPKSNDRKHPKPVQETFSSTKTYLTNDKEIGHRVNKHNKDVPKTPYTKPGFTEQLRHKIRSEDEEYTSDEDTLVDNVRNSSREPSVSPDRTRKVTRKDEDFYTLNIKVYKTDSQTPKKQAKPTTDDEEIYSDVEISQKSSKKPVEPAKAKPGRPSTTIYRTEEKHFVNKSVKQQPKPKTYPKDNTPERRSPTKQVQKVPNTRRPTTVKPKQEETRHVVTTTIQVVPKSKLQGKQKSTPKPLRQATKPSGQKINKTKQSRPLECERVATEEESEPEEYGVDGEHTEESRLYNRQITHTIFKNQKHPEPSRDALKKPDKVITTKSIIINNDFENEQEVVVKLQRSKSSRETTPDHTYVYPASDNEEKGLPRYPDEIYEPDDSYRRRRPTKLSDIPIIETEDTDLPTSHMVDETDECLLSVNEKVSKFVNEADKLTKTQKPKPNDRLNITRDFPERPKSPKCENYSEDDEEAFTSVSEKVSHFIETAEKVKSHVKSSRPAPKVKRPEFEDLDDTLRSDDCLLTVSDKVNKFTTTANSHIPEHKRPVSLAKMDVSTRQTNECVQIDSEEDTYTRTPPSRGSSPTKPSIDHESTPKTGRKMEPKTILSTTGRLRSTESIRRAKEIFESMATTTKKHILDQERQPKRDDVRVHSKLSSDDKCNLKSTRLVMEKYHHRLTPSNDDDDVPGYMRPLNRSPRPHSPYVDRSSRDRSRSPSIDSHPRPHDPSLDNIPHYMWPLDRSPHDHEYPHEDHEHSPKPHEASPSYSKPFDRQKTPTRKVDHDTNKTNKKTDSESQRRKFTTIEIENILTTYEIEEIYDIEILEFLLERAINYEQRSRVRSQIRIVKQLITDNKLPTVLIKKTPRTEPVKEPSVERCKPTKKVEEQTMYAYNERRRSSEVKVSETYISRKSPDRKPDVRKPETKNVFKTELKRVQPVSKKVVEEKPSWVTQRSLKKPSGDVPKTKSLTTTTRKQDTRTSPAKERKPIDAITSSYGVGPTDENGSPLFGLKALRAQSTTGTTKVQGTVIKSHYYSENGHEPVGEVSVTKYSSDPTDFEGVVDDADGLVSVTTTKKFGAKGTPTYKAIEDKEDYVDERYSDEHESVTESTTTTRRGSVKQMSRKFIENAVETSKNERQPSYPKAGLILRTSSFKKGTTQHTSSREPSPESEVATTTVKRTITSSAGRTDTFLTNQKRVTNVQDVITRMRNADNEVQEGDTAEDAEARKLLNKFIGSQVILSGMESNSSSSPSLRTSVKTTTTTTSTSSKGGGKPTVITRTFTHPITQEDLDTIWDEQTLKLLLERSTDYEERRIIRGRLRDIMAEKEVCADLTKATEESSGRVEGESLLLPLLQGLLDAPDNEQTADSGTESGEDLRNGLLVEVQNVLAKLAVSLKSDSNDMSEERRDSLLQLVNRLQTGLSHPGSNERRSSGHERFSKKRRQNRHTVGVSSEELENARKLIEEMGLCANKSSTDKHKSQEHITVPSVIKNVVAKPYQSPGSTSQSASCTSSAVNTPTEVTGVLQLSNPLASIRPKDLKLTHYEQNRPKPFNEMVSSNFFPEIEKKNLHNAHESNEDFVKAVDTAQTLLQSNPIYKPTNFPDLDEQKINNRFNNKKLKLKRANTIDIPKPVNTYESEEDYDSDTSLVDRQSTRRNNYLALRGPIRVGRNATTGNNVPVFEPKTESDRKFMAFINKHNERGDQSSLWAHQGQDLNNRNNWNNRFGNIRTAFEKVAVSNSTTPTPTTNSARNFWKQAENASSYCQQSNVPKGRLLQRRSEYISKDKEETFQKMPWSVMNESEVVTGSLKVETKGLDVNKNYKFIPQPLPMNKFSHAPTSAFAAIPKKYPDVINTKLNVPGSVVKTDYQNDNEANAPLFLYSPKPLTSTNTSPSSTPWANEISSVQKLAATRFGHNDPVVVKPRTLHKNTPFNSIPESAPVDKVTAPYINKSVENANTVRKLSDQFNNKTSKQPDTYLTTTTVRTNYTLPKYPLGDYTQYQSPSYDHCKSTKTHTPTYQTQSSIPQQPPSPQAPTQYYQQHHYQDIPKEPPTYKVVSAPKESRSSDEYISQSYLKIKPPSKPESELSSSDSSPTPQYNRQISQESVKEYEAAVTKVMKGPVSQQAVTVQQNSPRGRDQHDLEVALNLKNALQKFADKSPERKLSIDSAVVQNKSTPSHLQRKTQSFKKVSQKSNPNFMVNGKPLSMESTEINENGESVITSKFHIPVTIQSTLSKSPTQQQMVRKSDLWNQLMYDQQQVSQKPAPISSPNSKSVLRSKSSHSLAVPTVQFQAGMTKDEVAFKKRTVEAYFSGSISPQSLNKTPSDDSLDKNDKVEVKISKSSINRKKTSEKISANKQTTGVSRSQTLPNIACPDMLDESKVEESFEDLFRSNA